MRRFQLLMACIAIVLAAGCADAPSASVRGSAVSAYGGAYPVGSTMALRIVDPGGAGVIAETTRPVDPGWEIAGMNRTLDFVVPYDPARVEPYRIYLLQATVLDPNGRIIAVSDRFPALKDGVPEPVVLTLMSPDDQAGPSAEGSAAVTPSAR